MHSCISGDKSTSSLTQGKDIYELEVQHELSSEFLSIKAVTHVTLNVVLLQVLLRVKESEIQYLKQEINSLKDELQSALRVIHTHTHECSVRVSRQHHMLVCSDVSFTCVCRRIRSTLQISTRTFTRSSVS